MPNAQANIRSIFDQAAEIASPAERGAYLDEACSGAPEVRAQVEALLAAHAAAGSFLEAPPTSVASATEAARRLAPQPTLNFLSPPDGPDSLGRLGHYHILEVVGSGGFGVVLKARDEKLQRIVAVKTLAESLAASGAARQRFVREAIAAAAVRHENVVNIHAVDDGGPVPYLVMEYIDGESLEAKLKQAGSLELKEILRIGLQIAEGLAAAHKQGLVHRDVKPANILLENGVQRVKITDFGLARAADDASLTATGLIAGTPAYMSPEQARGEAVDHRSDLFSLGSVLYVMCTGQSAFRGSTTLGVIKRVCEEEPRPIRELNADIPEWLCAIVQRLHAKRADDRYQTAGEAAEDLRRGLAQLQLGSPLGQESHLPATRKAGGTPAPRQRRWLAPVMAAALLLALTLSITEAGGVTHLVPTVIRIVTGEGTLLVETSDPDVKISIEGDGGLAITGAGPQEVRIRPGKYRVKAVKDGQPLPLDKELVTITRGGKQVVKVTLEARPAVAPPETTSSPPAATAGADWVQLFNGKDLTGWKTPPSQPGNWRVESGLLIGSGPGTVSHLYTEQGDFEDFHLRVEAKINLLGNSGVYFRAPPQSITKFPAGYEAQICIERKAGTPGPESQKTGSLFGLVRQDQVPQGAGPDEWFTMEIIAHGPRTTIKVNGVATVNDFEDPLFRFRKGHLMLQQGNAETVVCFRKIEIKELPEDGSAAAALSDGMSSPVEAGSGAAPAPPQTSGTPSEQDTAVSEASLREAIRLRPRNSETHKRLGQFLEGQNRLSEAEAAFREAIRLAPGEPNYHACLSAVLRKQPDRFSEGVEELELANRLGPDQRYILSSLGHAYASGGRWEEAAPLFRRASELEPTEKWVAFKSATLSLYLGDLENYRLACRRLLDADKPGDEDRRPYNTAIACLLTPDGIGESERVRQIALDELSPARDDRYAGNVRALAELRAGQWRAAIEELSPPASKLGSHWRDPFPLVILAMAQQGSGDLPAAQQTLAKAKALHASTRPADQGRPLVLWEEWLQAEILLREAEELIAPQAKVEPAK